MGFLWRIFIWWSFVMHYWCIFVIVVSEMDKHLALEHCIEHTNVAKNSCVLKWLPYCAFTSVQTARCRFYVGWKGWRRVKFSFFIDHRTFLRKQTEFCYFERDISGVFQLTLCFFEIFSGRVGKQGRVSKMLVSVQSVIWCGWALLYTFAAVFSELLIK